VIGHLTIHWSRRGGQPPYRGQSCALAAPRLSSSVRCAPGLVLSLLTSPSWSHTRALTPGFSALGPPRTSAQSRTRPTRAGALFSPLARSGRLTIFDRIGFDRRPGLALSVHSAGPLRGSSRAGPNRRYEPPAHARQHTSFGAPESGRLLELRCAGIRRQPGRASRSFPPARRGPSRPLPDGPFTPYTGI
jgi:hypothetical protein